VKAGDVVVAVNGSPTATLTDFFRATGKWHGFARHDGFIRRGQRFQAVVDASVTTAPVAPFAALAAATPTPPPSPHPWPRLAVAHRGEWLGLEVAPISSITAISTTCRPGLPGLLVVEAEAQAATVGAKAGDVLQFVNGVPTLDMTKFFMATKNGTVAAGTIVLWRKGEQMVTRLGQAVAAPTSAGRGSNGEFHPGGPDDTLRAGAARTGRPILRRRGRALLDPSRSGGRSGNWMVLQQF